ncbi:MAG: N-6 DNA methylase, partial [ANME-2 cluster archaeon]|nr:N-6 DNA methylase [ANME-2 cluster archaeon]
MQELDERPVRGKPSAHDALQAYLNVHEDKWAILTNGRYLRLLRDFHHTFTLGYIEFDLEAIFLHRSYADFHALFRFAHASRFVPVPLKDPDKANIYLEEYFNYSQTAGESVGKDLRENVVKAIEAFGNGFLNHELLDELKENEVECQRYYEEILKVIYRIIFLLYAEQRGMLGGGVAPGNNLYLEEYSITALRELAVERQVEDDRHTDLWEGLLVTFRIIKQGAEKLGIYPYNGMLFEMSNDDYLSNYRCQNSYLLTAIRYLTITYLDKIMQRISYADLSVEEIGAIYESLLDYTPRVIKTAEEIEGNTYAANSFILDPRGSDRKSTGSYYTNPALIQELIKSALEPVIKDRLEHAGESIEEREKELLSIKVCDPACGSGAFLIAACNKLGNELAKLRYGEDLPPQNMLQEARRDVLQHCIYGVDLNPMAVELAKVSLWINAIVRNRPLNFLDHHIKCGNSLIGATPELMKKGIPTEAFNPVEGDRKEVAQYFKKINKEQLKNTTFTQWLSREDTSRICFEKFVELDEAEESDPQEVNRKKEQYEHLVHSFDYNKVKFLADLWTSAFFWNLNNKDMEVPTQDVFTGALLQGASSVSLEITKKVSELAKEYRFFHWYVEFPEVFGDENPGFDCVLGNPPWERIKLQEKEFFEYRDPEIANAQNAAERKKMIKNLRELNPSLIMSFNYAKRMSESETSFLRNSRRFPLTGKGDINTYSVFTEHARNLINRKGQAGIIVPTGIATDKTTSDFFGDIVEKKSLSSLYDFENKKGYFPIHRSFKFCFITMCGENASPTIDLAFFLHDVDNLNDEERHFSLTPEDIRLINPNTLSSPIFRNKRDAEITKAVYQ